MVVISSGFHKTHVTTAAGEISGRGLLSLAITGLIGRLLLNRTGLAIALVLPFLAAVLLGGWCIAGMSGPVLG